MQRLEIQRKKQSPQVLLDHETGTGSIEGGCYSEDIFDIFQAIQHWFGDYATLQKSFSLIINVDYYNTGAAKCFATLFETIDGINRDTDEDWNVTIVTQPETQEEDRESWLEHIPDFPTATFEIQ